MQKTALLGRLSAFLTGHSRSLIDLTTKLSGTRIRSRYSAGSRTVRISQITGSEDRSGDFDRDFNPIQTRTIQRWMSVAMARMCGVILPPVELIQVGDDYFVRDGHHRISVARALGEDYIDAQVTILEVEPASLPSAMLILKPVLG
jgi:hypothetical protein